MVTEVFTDGKFYLTGSFDFELGPTSGAGGAKMVEGTFRDVVITYDQMSC